MGNEQPTPGDDASGGQSQDGDAGAGVGDGGDAEGTGGEASGGSGSGGAPEECEDCSPTQGCVAGTCVEQSCEPEEFFCSGGAVHECDVDGLDSTEVETCEADEYCDAATGRCREGVCAANEPSCDQNTSRLCNAEGTAYVADSAVDCTTEGQTCVSGSCQGVCAPDETQCDDNDLQTCNSSGQYGSGVACDNTTCLGEPGSASCEGECAPGQVQCSGNGVATCNGETGLYDGSVTGCTSTSPHCAGGACGPPPSCQGLTTNCGSSANESCCTSVIIDGGVFNRINDDQYPASVADFRLDKFEVTVGRWRKFVAAWDDEDDPWRPEPASGKHDYLDGGGLASSYPDGGFETGWNTSWTPLVDTSSTARQEGGTYATWTTVSGTNENRPINYVNWYEGQAFCIWDGGFLPSEAEWNYAAAGGDSDLPYPWGPDTPTCSLANFLGGSGSTECYSTFTTNVGVTGGDGLYGHEDLAGNLWEWTLDWHATPATAFLATCQNCAYLPSDSTLRVTRGGAFNAAATSLPNSYRNGGSPGTRTSSVGVRCARAP